MNKSVVGLGLLALTVAPFVLLGTGSAQAAGGENTRIVYTSTGGGGEDIWIMNADGTGATNLTPENGNGDYLAAISRDGKMIAYNADLTRESTEVFVMNVDGSNKRRVTKCKGGNFHPAFSPDGKKIVFHSIRDGVRQIYVINVDGTGETRLNNDKFENRDPSFSPDGKKIVFISNRGETDSEGAGNFQIYTMNVDGSGIMPLTTGPAFNLDPAYSPDGKKIVFTTNRDFNAEIYIMNADGTGQQRVTSTTTNNESHPSFSPDGAKIVYHTNRDRGNYEIYTVNIDGTGETRLTNTRHYNWYPVWGPDAR